MGEREEVGRKEERETMPVGKLFKMSVLTEEELSLSRLGVLLSY